MGLFRAAIIFVIGNFFISLLDKHLDKVKEIPIVGPTIGEDLKAYINNNKTMAIVILLSLVEFIM